MGHYGWRECIYFLECPLRSTWCHDLILPCYKKLIDYFKTVCKLQPHAIASKFSEPHIL